MRSVKKHYGANRHSVCRGLLKSWEPDELTLELMLVTCGSCQNRIRAHNSSPLRLARYLVVRTEEPEEPEYSYNPLEPRTPEAPPWDPDATANGVYATDDFLRATDYAFLVGDLTDSKPVVIEIESAGLTRHPDPQALDLLSEPYDYYRQDLLNYVRDAYVEKLLELKSQGITGEARRELLGTFRDFAFKRVTSPNAFFRPLRIQYTIGSPEKVEAAQAIFPQDFSWAPLDLFREYYGSEAPIKIWEWLDWRPDPDEGPFSSQSLFCPLGSQIPNPILNMASNMFYFDITIDWDRITKAWILDQETATKTAFINQGEVRQPVFHGTSLSRFNEAFQSSYQ